MNKTLLLSALLPVWVVACSSADNRKMDTSATIDTMSSAHLEAPATNTMTNGGYFTFAGDSVVIPAFDIDVRLNPEAEAKLRADNETVIVAAYFSGVPTDTTSKSYLKSHEYSVVNHRIELRNSRTARFENVKFPKAVYDSLADKDIHLLINVYSGRKASADNLLACSILEAAMSTVKGKRFTITGKLVYGED